MAAARAGVTIPHNLNCPLHKHLAARSDVRTRTRSFSSRLRPCRLNITQFGSSDAAVGVALRPDGKIIAGGNSRKNTAPTTGITRLELARYPGQ